MSDHNKTEKDIHEMAREAISKLRSRIALGEDIFASREHTEDLQEYVGEVLEGIGEVLGIDSNNIFVTDLSSIWDFSFDDIELDKLSALLGTLVGPKELILDVAQRLRDKDSI